MKNPVFDLHKGEVESKQGFAGGQNCRDEKVKMIPN